MFKKIFLKIKILGGFILNKVYQKPFLSLGLLMVVFFALLIAGAYIRKPNKVEITPQKAPLRVETYIIGSAPKIKVLAKVQKSNVIKITSQTNGIVSGIWVAEGQEVGRGTTLISLASNYYGTSAFSLQKQIAKANLDSLEQTIPIQLDLISKQKELTEKNDSNSDELRNINSQSLSETRDLLSLNQEILNTLEANLKNYEATNSAGINNALILSTKQLKTQYQTAVNSLNSSLRTLEYQSDGSKNPALISDLSKEITFKQLEIQEKTLKLSEEIARLQYQLSVVNESLYYPSSPFEGRIEKIHVQVGQSVSPGTVLVTFSGKGNNFSAEALVSQKIARKMSRLEPAVFIKNNKKYEIYPEYISKEAVEGTLYMIRFNLGDLLSEDLTDGEYLEVLMSLGYPNTSQSVPFIPIDSVYQTGEGAYVYIVGKEGIAKAKKVVLGEIYGQLVEVKSGLKEKDRIILDRKVIAGDKVEVL